MTPQEVQIRKMFLEYNVSVQEVADYFDVTYQAITNRLKSLTPSSKKELEEAIRNLSDKHAHQKVAS